MLANGCTRIATLAAALVLVTGCGRAGFAAAGEDPAGRLAIAAAAGRGLPTISEARGPRAGEEVVVPPRPTRPAPAPVGGNEAVLSVGTAETLPAVKAFISGARRTLWIEMFEFGGSYAKQLVPLLIARAKAGVEVKLLVDQVGSGSEGKGIKAHIEALQAAGVELRFYNAKLRKSGSLWRFNITHRKLLLADESVGMAGGTNFGQTFDTTTHDLMVRWRGPVVADLYREFVTEWKTVGGPQLAVPPAPAPVGDLNAQVAVTSVPEGRFEIRDAVFKAIDGAQREVLVEQQYIWEDGLEDHLLAALKRGVKVRVMIPGGTKEQPVLAALNNEALKRLADAGAEARAYRDPETPVAHLHVKYFAVDDRWVATGSANGDARSLMDHQELDVLSTSPTFVRHTKERLFERDWARAGMVFTYKPLPWYVRPFRSVMELVDYLF